jgi:hypothetical protein
MNLPQLTVAPDKQEAEAFVRAVFRSLSIPSSFVRNPNGMAGLSQCIDKYTKTISSVAGLPASVLKTRTIRVYLRTIDVLNAATRCDYFNSDFRRFLRQLFENLQNLSGYPDYESFLGACENLVNFAEMITQSADQARERITEMQRDFERTTANLPHTETIEAALEVRRAGFAKDCSYCLQNVLLAETLEPLAKSFVDLVGTVEKEM